MRVDLDVAVLGGGLAGNLLARQLRRRLPGLRVALFERASERSYKVGESTVEIASHYLVRRQGLSQYLYDKHLPKNGIRYFFDSAECDTPLTEMSELGTVNLPFHPAFQLDRAAHGGRPARDERPRGRGRAHRRAGGGRRDRRSRCAPRRGARRPGRRERLSARWLVDAGGREGFLARRLGWRVPEAVHRIGSVWARFEGVADIDQLGDDAFRARVRHTSRGLSTMHFLYAGYWIWVIPLRGRHHQRRRHRHPGTRGDAAHARGLPPLPRRPCRAARAARRRQGGGLRQPRAHRLRHATLLRRATASR